MPEVINLGFCPRCNIDLIEEPIGYIKHVRFCRLCREAIQFDPFMVQFYIDIAERTKELQKECNRPPTINAIEPGS